MVNWWLLEKPMSSLSFGELAAFKKPVSSLSFGELAAFNKPVSSLSFGELAAFKKPVCWVAALEPMKMEQYRETFW